MSQQEEQDQEVEEDEQQQEEGDQDDEDDEDQQGDQDQDQDGDQDEDQDGDDEQQGDQDQQGDQEQQQKPVPTFKTVSEQFTFKNLVAQIASLGNSVDHFINTLPSRGGSVYRSYQPRVDIEAFKTRTIQLPVQPEQKKYTIMKDQDTQVSMQPQIVIQQTLAPREQPKKQPYRISNQSTKFLAQLYEQNKKLKRWQNTQTGGLQTQSQSFYKSNQSKFQRPEHERGLINLDDRNKEIDEAIQMLRREQQGYN